MYFRAILEVFFQSDFEKAFFMIILNNYYQLKYNIKFRVFFWGGDIFHFFSAKKRRSGKHSLMVTIVSSEGEDHRTCSGHMINTAFGKW